MDRSTALALALGTCLALSGTAHAEEGGPKGGRGIAQHIDPSTPVGNAKRPAKGAAPASKATPEPQKAPAPKKPAFDAALGEDAPEPPSPARSLLDRPTLAAFKEWRELTPDERARAYRELGPSDRERLDATTRRYVENQLASDLAGPGSASAFGEFGKNLNLVPAIQLEPDPARKLRLVGESYANVVGSKVHSIDPGYTGRVRSQVGNENDYGAVIERGGGTCGELTYSLRDAINGAFGDRTLPASRDHVVDAQAIEAKGVFMGIVPVGAVSNHASTLVQIDDQVVVCDPAYYLFKNKSLSGFAQSEWFEKPATEWVRYWRSSSEWGTAMGNFSDDQQRKGDATTKPWMILRSR